MPPLFCHSYSTFHLYVWTFHPIYFVRMLLVIFHEKVFPLQRGVWFSLPPTENYFNFAVVKMSFDCLFCFRQTTGIEIIYFLELISLQQFLFVFKYRDFCSKKINLQDLYRIWKNTLVKRYDECWQHRIIRSNELT